MLNQEIDTRIGGLWNFVWFGAVFTMLVSKGTFAFIGMISIDALMQVVFVILKAGVFLSNLIVGWLCCLEGREKIVTVFHLYQIALAYIIYSAMTINQIYFMFVWVHSYFTDLCVYFAL